MDNKSINSNEEPTKEINLKDLYDGKINSTVIMDPVTKNEVLIKEKKNNILIYAFLLVMVSILGLYFVYYKTDYLKKTPVIKPKTTKIITTTVNNNDLINGTLSCTYSDNTDEESITSTIEFTIEKSAVVDSTFNLNVASKNENISDKVNVMLNSYEKLFIDNASIVGNNIEFEKKDKDFTVMIKSEYEVLDFDSVTLDDEIKKLYLNPKKEDTYETLNSDYLNLGYSCTLTRSNNE